MSRHATVITLSVEDRASLEAWARAGKSEQRLALRARIVMAAAEGQATTSIAKSEQVRPATVTKWRKRFAEGGMASLLDAPRSGKPSGYSEETNRRILAMLDQPAPKGHAIWTGGLLAKALGDVSTAYAWRFLRDQGISLERRRSWCISTDPEFVAKAADVVGLYLAPPENAIVICVDEKPSIQALERAQGWLRLPNGKALTGYSHEYKRHGTTTLFAALEVATGLVKKGHYRRKRRVEFLDFMNSVVSGYPTEVELHVILDNLSTHKPKRDAWLSRHKNVHFHFIPTHASWMNMVEIFFSLLSRAALRGASYTTVAELRLAINDFCEVYNEEAQPFEWRKAVVQSVAPKYNYANLRK